MTSALADPVAKPDAPAPAAGGRSRARLSRRNPPPPLQTSRQPPLRKTGGRPVGRDVARTGGSQSRARRKPAETEEKPSSKPAKEQLPALLAPIPADEVINILGEKVRGPAGEDMGMIVDVLVDAAGRPRAAVIDFGGFLGVGSRKIAVGWQALNFRPADRSGRVLLTLARAEVQAAPEYKPSGQPAAVVTPPAVEQPGICRGRPRQRQAPSGPAGALRRRTQLLVAASGFPSPHSLRVMRDPDPEKTVAQAELPDRATRAAGRGLDWLNLFVANVQTGFGPFISVYLTTAGWTQTGIGLALSVGTVAAMASQVPAGALVDAIRRKSRVAVFSILSFTASALFLTIAPIPLFVYLAQVLHAFSSCTLGPSIVAMTRAVAGPAALGPRLGRNVRFAAIGNGIGAALMGACGYYVSERSVFFLTALLTLPALLAIVPLARFDDLTIEVREARRAREDRRKSIAQVLSDRHLLMFAAVVALFTFANAAMLPLASAVITKQAADEASLLIAAGIVLPQAIVALLSPMIGKLAEARGRRLVLMLGFSVVPVRGLLFAVVGDLRR